jgi:hypothetical protein
MHSEVALREDKSLVHRLVEPMKGEERFRLKGKSHRDKYDPNSERKLPLILQGRLKSLSP